MIGEVLFSFAALRRQSERNREMQHRLESENFLVAVKEGLIQPHFRPLVDLETGEAMGFETLGALEPPRSTGRSRRKAGLRPDRPKRPPRVSFSAWCPIQL